MGNLIESIEFSFLYYRPHGKSCFKYLVAEKYKLVLLFFIFILNESSPLMMLS